MQTKEAIKQVATEKKLTEDSVKFSYYRWKDRLEEGHGSQLFSAFEELLLLSAILARSTYNTPFSRVEFLDYARRLKNLPADWSGSSWFRGFKRRHKGVFSCRKTKALDKNRTRKNLVMDVQTWLQKIETFLQDHRTLPRWIFNADESPIRVSDRALHNCLLESKAKARPSKALPKAGRHASFLPFVNTLGETWLVAYLVSGKKRVDKEAATFIDVSLPLPKVGYLRRGDYQRIWLATGKGFINGPAWSAVLRAFVKVIDAHRQTEEVIIFIDNASPHKHIDTIKYLLKKKVYLVYLPPGTTDMIQPLDDKILANWRNVLGRRTRHHYRSSPRRRGNLIEAIMALSPGAEAEALRPKVIKAAWKDTGLYPWNTDKVLGRLEEGRRAPIPELYPAHKEVVAEHMEMFRQLVEEANEPEPEQVKIRMPVNTPYTGEEVVEAKRAKEAAALQKKEEQERSRKQKEEKALERKRAQVVKQKKEALDRKRKLKARVVAVRAAEKRKLERSCRLCGAYSQKGVTWLGCDRCEWWVCTTCRRTSDGDGVVAAHEATHERKSRKKRQRPDCPEQDEV